MASPTRSESPPGGVPLLGHFPAYARDPLGFVTRVSAEYGGVVPMRLGPFPALLLTDPDAIYEVLVNPKGSDKGSVDLGPGVPGREREIAGPSGLGPICL